MKQRNLFKFIRMAGIASQSLTASQGISASTRDLSEPISLALGDPTIDSGRSPGVEINGYMFTGTADHSLRIIAFRPTNFFDPMIELRNLAGTALQTQSCNTSSFPCTTFSMKHSRPIVQ
jgi:hypothetical protein